MPFETRKAPLIVVVPEIAEIFWVTPSKLDKSVVIGAPLTVSEVAVRSITPSASTVKVPVWVPFENITGFVIVVLSIVAVIC